MTANYRMCSPFEVDGKVSYFLDNTAVDLVQRGGAYTGGGGGEATAAQMKMFDELRLCVSIPPCSARVLAVLVESQMGQRGVPVLHDLLYAPAYSDLPYAQPKPALHSRGRDRVILSFTGTMCSVRVRLDKATMKVKG
jgi:hypothetical protein